MAYGVLPRISQHLLNGFEKECGSSCQSVCITKRSSVSSRLKASSLKFEYYRVWIPALLLTSFVTLSKLFNLQCPLLENGNAYVIGFL